jgi:uncharacterized protein (DUF697 family)
VVVRTKLMAAQESSELVDSAALSGALLSWMPGSTVILSANELRLIGQIADKFGVRNWGAEGIAADVAALAGRRLAAEFGGLIPIAGWIVKAMVAPGITWALGEATIRYMWARSPLPDELRVINVASGRALDVAGWNTGNGAVLHVWDWHGGQNQWWTVGYAKDDCRMLIAYPGHDMRPSKVVDVPGHVHSGLPLQIWEYGGGDNQTVRLSQREDGAYTIVLHWSNLVLVGSGHENGSLVFARPDHGDSHARWWIAAA